jgi:hypothetical protein
MNASLFYGGNKAVRGRNEASDLLFSADSVAFCDVYILPAVLNDSAVQQ